MSDRITIMGITGHGYHGVLASEKAEGQPFSIDVVLETDIRSAAGSDDLTQTIDYSVIAELVHSHITGEGFDLIETLVERIASAVLAACPATAVEVTVHKPNAPIAVPFSDVTISIRRER
ncbi:MAG: dihydroneopterin aldolase [Candidatus Nanopelagicales bacterium]